MIRTRLRLAGSLLLGTLLLSLAEAAWAATCEPAMAEMPVASGPETTEIGGISGHECPPGTSHEPRPMDGSGNADCPFGPAGFGCAFSASLPAAATQVREPVPLRTHGHSAAAVLARDLQSSAIFHPPKV